MGQILDFAKSVYRAWVTDMVPASGPNEPSKTDIITLFQLIDSLLGGALTGATPVDTAAHLPAPTGSNKIYIVTSDSTVANNGYWQDQGTSNVQLNQLNAFLKGATGAAGANGTMAPSSGAQLVAGSDNTTSVTPLGLTTFGFSQPTNLFFAGQRVAAAITDQNSRGAFLTVDGMWRGKLGVAASGGALVTSYDPVGGVTTFSLPALTSITGKVFVGGKEAGLILSDNSSPPLVWGAGWLDGRFYIGKLVVGAITMADGTPVGGGNAGEAVSTTDILMSGDSLSTGPQGPANELQAQFSTRSVTTIGVGSRTAVNCSTLFGVQQPVSVAGNTIPASGSVAITLATALNPYGSDPMSAFVSINDVPGLLLNTTAGGLTFTRTTAGGAVTTPATTTLRQTSTSAFTSDGSTTVPLKPLQKRIWVPREGHNDIVNGILRNAIGSSGYSRDAVKQAILAQKAMLTPGHPRVVACSITRGVSWLTQARIDALYPGSGITSFVRSGGTDADTVLACMEATALNQWLSETFEGFANLLAAYEAANAAYVTSVDFGSGNVFKFGTPTIFPDGTHGTDGGVAQTIDAATIAGIINAKGW